MSTFDERMASAEQFEKELVVRFQSQGWHATPFGQGELPPEFRDGLNKFESSFRRPSKLRWLPDILAFRYLSENRSYVALIDAKKCADSYPNYSFERS